MFEIRCLVGDKKLSDVLRILKGHTFGLPTILPRDDDEASEGIRATSANGAVKPGRAKWTPGRKKPISPGGKHLKGTGSITVIREIIEKSGVTHISASEMKKATIAAGYSSGAYSHAAKLLVAGKWLKKLDTIGDYEVTRPTLAAQPTDI